VRSFALLLLLVAAPAAAETVQVGFAPPTGKAMLYHMEQKRSTQGREARLSADRVLRFEKAGAGYVLHVVLRGFEAEGPEEVAEPFRAAMTPLEGVEQVFRLDAGGRIVSVDNMDALWSAAGKGVDEMLARFPADSARHKAALRIQALFESLSEDARVELLAGELKPLLMFADTPVVDGAGRGLRSMAGSPLGRPVPVEGQVAMTKRAGDKLTLDEALAGQGVAVAIRYRASAASGLVEEQQRQLSVGDRQLAEIRTLTPLPD
jgi:hypothetical protein